MVRIGPCHRIESTARWFKVTTITVGGAGCDPIIRKALAIGADDAVRIDSEPTDALQVARLIAGLCQQEKEYDVVLCGKETIDHNGAVVPAMLAEIAGLWLRSERNAFGSQRFNEASG